ncbi:MAG: twin-arginine translocase subunit TatC [Actinobacteria bacterium]|uniref:Sec-independent protein translocase protein TatC n=1 Tax=Candidatus Fonsibacter lacus TaxID=2576439 RepID=A0A965GBE2_9PROT|nr:twin-arginine translocase subunit TatC [Candidatus Fonsibacter lacus]
MSINGEIDPSKAPVLAHLRELRKRVFKSALGVLLLAIVGWVFYNQIILKLAQPICGKNGELNDLKECTSLYVSGVLGPLNLQIKVALLVGVILAAPIWLYQIWAFVLPGLKKREKTLAFAFFVGAIPFFAAGVTLGYYILPVAIKVLLGFTPDNLNNLIRFDDYLDFVLRVILLFGIAFELPVFLLALNAAGALTGRAILKPWRVAVFLIFLFVAAFTPTGDPLTMLALALPLCALYLSAGGICLLIDKRREKKSLANNEG